MGDINSNLRLICGSVEIEQAAAELVNHTAMLMLFRDNFAHMQQ